MTGIHTTSAPTKAAQIKVIQRQATEQKAADRMHTELLDGNPGPTVLGESRD